MVAINTVDIINSSSLKLAVDRFNDDIGEWVNTCIMELSEELPSNVHDQGTFTTGWEPYIVSTNDKRTYNFMTKWRDQISSHFEESGKWKHGYWMMHEAHHGTEHFELFLGALCRLQPEDPETIRQIQDAAEHIGNWVQDIPEWFDDQTGLFRSMYFGVSGVKEMPGSEMNVPDHLRCINICLLAYQVTKKEHYLRFAKTYSAKWADAILAQHDIPIGIHKDGGILFSPESEEVYREFVGELAEDMSQPVNLTENLLASGGMNALLELFRITGERRFIQAVEKLLDVLVTQIKDPDAGAAVDMLRKYRHITQDTRYDDAVREAVADLKPFSFKRLSIEPEVTRSKRPAGIGKRSDMPAWYEDGQERRNNPILLAFAAEISGDEGLATRAIDLARTYFQLAREVFPHGQHHGCSAGTVSAVARGHGRDNHAGMTTAVLGPIINRFVKELE